MKFTAAERTGLMVVAVIVIAASVAMAIFSHIEKSYPIPENTVPVAVDSLIRDVEATDTVAQKPQKSQKSQKQKHPTPAPAPRNHLDETF